MESESEEEEERQVQWMFFQTQYPMADPDKGPKDPPPPTPKGLDAPLVSLPHVRFQC